jgi:GntR family transcriptional regulator
MLIAQAAIAFERWTGVSGMAEVMRAAVAPLLGVEVGSALLAVSRLIFDDQERPVQWLNGLYRPDRYQYEMQLSRIGGIDAKVWVSKELSAQFH